MPRRQLITLLAFSACAAAVIGMPLALLARFEDERGIPTEGLGLIAAASFLVAPVSQFLLARWADRGHSRALIAGGTLAIAVGAVGFALVDRLWLLVLARAVSGAGYGAISPTVRAILTRADPDRAGERLGALSAAELAGFIGGPAAAAVIAQMTTLGTPFVAGAIVISVLVVPVLTGSGAVRARVTTGSMTDVARSRPSELIRRAPVLGSALMLVALAAPAGLYDAIWARYLTDLGAGNVFVGLSLAMFGVPFAIVSPLAGRLADRVNPMNMALVAIAPIIPLTVIYGQLKSPWTVMGLAMIEAVANGSGNPAALAAMSQACGPDEQATGQGIAGGMGQISAGIMALVAAPVYARVGPGPMFAVAAATMAVIALWAAWTHPGVGRFGRGSAQRSSKEPLRP